MKHILALVFMLMLTQVTWADPTVTVIKQLNGSAVTTTSPGEVTSAIANGTCTLTMTPAYGNLVSKNFITVYSVVSGNMAQAPTRRSPNIDNTPIEVRDAGDNTDPSGVTHYEFTIPDDGSDVEVTVNFQSMVMYDLFIGETQVTELNVDDVLKDGKVSFIPAIDASGVNTLMLNGANIGMIRTSLSTLTIELIGDNILSSGSSPAFQNLSDNAVTVTVQSSASTKGSLTLNMSGSSTNTFVGSNVTLNIIEPLAVVAGKLDAMSDNAQTAIIGESYGLTVAGAIVSKFNASAITGEQIQLNTGGAVTFDLQSNTLTLNNVELSAITNTPIIVSSLDRLTVNVVGQVVFNFNNAPAYVFQSTDANAVLTFTATGEGNASIFIPKGIEEGLFTGFKTVEYENGLVLGTIEGDIPSYTIAPVEAPVFGDFFADEVSGQCGGYIGTTSTYDGATLKYTITYADGIHQNVPETDYEESVTLEGPATLTAYVVLDGSKGPVATAKYFGFTQHEIADTLGKASQPVPTLVPAIQETDGLTVSYSSDAGIASVADGVIVKGGKVGRTEISAILNTGSTEPSFTVLNNNYEGGYRVDGLTVTVVPVAPSVGLEGGSYNDTQYVTLTPNLPEGVTGLIHYKRIVNGVEKVDSTYTVPLTISETTTLTYYQEAFDEDGAPFLSETKSVTYVIRQEPGYHFSDSESGQSYYADGTTVYNLYFGQENTLPWLINVPEGMAITYASEDANVATIDETGVMTLTGAGHVWITASSEATDVYKAHTERIRLEITPIAPQVSLAEGVYFTGQTVTLTPTVPNGTLYYSYGSNGELIAYTNGEEIELPEGIYEFKGYTRCVTAADESDTDYMQSYGSATNYYVFDEPVISKNSGTYDGPLEVEISGLPENAQTHAYYYFDDDEEHATLYDAEEKITVTANATLKVYLFVEGDSGKTYKSRVIEREYSIRQDAGLAYLQDNEQVEVAVYTIGGTDNQELPTLENMNELAITYSSSNTAVATINDEGEVSVVGIGETTITAISAQTEEVSAGEASYQLIVNKALNHESITVTVESATFTGEELEPAVTVMDGNTDITDYVIVSYSNNINPGEGTVTLTPNDELEVNYYVGSTTATFTINYRTLTVGEDMSFASGQTWATYYNTEESLNLPEGIAAYVVTSIDGSTVNLQAISYVPVNTAVLLEQTSTMPATNDNITNNELNGTASATAVSSINDGAVYVLYNGMFVRSISGTIPANRAYLVLGTSGADAPTFLTLNLEVSGVRVPTVGQTGNDKWYDLNGRKLNGKPTNKGLYILNGKKAVVR